MMRVNLLLPTLLLAQILSSQSTETADALQQRKDQEIRELSQQIQYYKKAVNSAKAIRSANFEDVRFDLTQVTGSRKDGNIAIGFNYTNQGQLRKTLQCEKAVIVDMQGNQYQSTQVFLAPNGKVVVADVLSKVPYRGAIFYKKVTNYFPIIRSLSLYVYPSDNISNPSPVVFENIPVIWE